MSVFGKYRSAWQNLSYVYQSQRHQVAETDRPRAKGPKISPQKKKIIISQDASAANNLRNSIFGTSAPPTGSFGETLVQSGGHLSPFHALHMLAVSRSPS
ncbi:hypothetical protein J3459_007407 [Metarhizium acridum]|nr:hypothetical protein J3459_007407 [Metarhizium acridum]